MYAYFFGMSLLWWVFWVAVIAAFFALIVPVPRRRYTSPTALEVLQRRYAAGEIDTVEYESRLNRLLAADDGGVVVTEKREHRERRPDADDSPNATLRSFNMIASGWLFLSAFLWGHSAAQRVNTWIVGAVCFVVAYVALGISKARYINVAVAIWLAISAFALPRISALTMWNNFIVALAILVAAVLPVGRANVRAHVRAPHEL